MFKVAKLMRSTLKKIRHAMLAAGCMLLALGVRAQDVLFPPAATPAPLGIGITESQPEPETSYNAPALGGGTQASALTGFDVNEPIEGGTLRGQFRTPEAPVLGRVLIPDWWGLTKDAEGESGYWAVQGVRVMTVDLLEGKLPASRGEAQRINKTLDMEQALKAVSAAFERAAWGFGERAAESKPLPTVIIGYGTGADLALRLAAEKGDAAAVVVLYYGGVTADAALAARIKAEVIGVFAEQDAWVTPQRAEAFQRLLSAHQVKSTFFSYNAQSGFALNNKRNHERAYIQQARTELWNCFNALLAGGKAPAASEDAAGTSPTLTP